MKPKIVPPSEVAKEIADIVTQLAADVELKTTAEQRKQSAVTRLHDMLTLFTLAESMALIRLIVEPRVRCVRCNAARPMRDCAGAYCLPCSADMRRADETRVARDIEASEAEPTR